MSVIDGTSANDRITPDLITKGVTGTPSAFPDDGDDELHGHAGNDLLVAGGGSDFIFGDDFDSEKGNDTLDGGAGDDFLYGHYGNDTYIVDSIGDQVFESIDGIAGGIDTVRSSVISVNLSAYDGDGLGLDNVLLTGAAALDGTGNHLANLLTGNGAANTLFGRGSADTLEGGGGADTLRGQGGNDIIHGAAGADVLIGGSGSDTFRFLTTGESTPGAADQLSAGDSGTAFDGAGGAPGDTIDLAGIDANTTIANNQVFIFGGTGKGHLSLVDSGTDTLVRGNVDNDAAFEFQLVIHDGNVRANAYTDADFIL